MMFELLSFGEQGWGNALLKGLWMTLQISAGSFAVGLLIGLIVFCVVVSGISGAGDLKKVGRIGLKPAKRVDVPESDFGDGIPGATVLFFKQG